MDQHVTEQVDNRSVPLSFVYFIQAETGGLIKIGRSWDPDTRLGTLQLSCPVKLVILATQFGGEPEERALHRKFKKTRVYGEWFRPTPKLLALVSSLQGQGHRKTMAMAQLESYMTSRGMGVTIGPDGICVAPLAT